MWVSTVFTPPWPKPVTKVEITPAHTEGICSAIINIVTRGSRAGSWVIGHFVIHCCSVRKSIQLLHYIKLTLYLNKLPYITIVFNPLHYSSLYYCYTTQHYIISHYITLHATTPHSSILHFTSWQLSDWLLDITGGRDHFLPCLCLFDPYLALITVLPPGQEYAA